MQYQILLMLLCMLLCVMVPSEKKRKTIVLPFCFLVLTFFFAIRYYYGLDYTSYLNAFEMGSDSARRGDEEIDVGFYKFMHLFNKFYIFIIVQTVLLFGALFYLTKKYCNHSVYALFFFMLLTQNGLIFNMISALRNSIAAIILWVFIEFFYFRKKKWLIYLLGVFIANMFHRSALVFILLPLIDFLIPKIKLEFSVALFIVASIVPVLFANTIFQAAVSNVDSFSVYQVYAQSNFNSNITGVIVRSLWLFPTYFMVKYARVFKGNNQGLYVIAIFFIFIYITNMDWQDRFSTYLKIFWIYALSQVIPRLNKNQKFIALVPLVVAVLFSFYQFMTSMYTEYINVPGNYLFYHTIFDAPNLP